MKGNMRFAVKQPFSAVFTWIFSPWNPLLPCDHVLALPSSRSEQPDITEVLHVKQIRTKMGPEDNTARFSSYFLSNELITKHKQISFWTQATEREERMAATETPWGRRGKVWRNLLKTTTCLYILAQLWAPTLVSGFYLRGDCGLALSQRDVESNISHHMEM